VINYCEEGLIRQIQQTVTAHRLFGGSGSAKHRSGYALCDILLHHILPALVLLRKPLFGLAKRQLPRTLSEKNRKYLRYYLVRVYSSLRAFHGAGS